MNNFNNISNHFTLRFIFLMILMGGIFNTTLKAQYCTSAATNPADEDIARVTLQGNTVKLDNISNTSPGTNCQLYTDYTALQPADLTAGSTYTISIVSTTCGGVFTHRALAWIDYNQNFSFESGEAVGPVALTSSGNPHTFTYTFTVPCNVKTGNTRLRVVLIEGAIANPGNACGTYTWGETEDYTVNVSLPTSLAANFIAPSSVWIKSVATFVNSNQTGYITHTWDANNDGTIEAPNSVNFNYTWNSGGTKCVKLRSSNCLGRDSIVKCLTVNVPTAVPVANFVTNKSLVEQYQTAIIYDLSTNGPYKWLWKVYDSTDVNDVKDINSGDVTPDPFATGANETTGKPEFAFNRPGCYTVELVSTNDVGNSNPIVKKCYITVISPTEYVLGFGTYGPNNDNIVESPSGTIFDNGGKNGNYGNNQGLGTRSFLQITPCNATRIELTLSRLKFNGIGDRLRIWDGKGPGGANTTLLGSFSAGSKAPQTLVARSGSMYILFESDNTGVDSGFAGSYTSILGTGSAPTPSFTTNTIPSYNSTPVLFTNRTTNIIGVPTWVWSVDGNEVGYKKDLNYTFYTDGQYDVCLEIKSCVGNKKSCQTIDVVTPNSQVSLDITASNRRPEVNISEVQLNPISDAANRYEWTIFPTSYVLLNPPASPSASGTGFIRYNATPGDSVPKPKIRFTSPGCYTIALKAYNSLDPTNTTKTVVKNDFICALDYCNPTSLILATDIGINNVRLLDNNTSLITNGSSSGIAAYTDYSPTIGAELTFGKTYTLEVTRNITSDPANRKAWIDWNIDGDFNDAGEMIMIEASSYNKTISTSFTVPNINDAFEGNTILRIATNFDNEPTAPCGPVTAGEYEDYKITLLNDRLKPVLTLIGDDTVRLERNTSYTDPGAIAIDPSEGNISNKIIADSDLDVAVPGLYSTKYSVTDNSGNEADPIYRYYVVVNDLTPPVITLNPGSTGCIEARRDNPAYVDPGAVAYNTNPFISLNSAIRVDGEVNTQRTGIYKLTYSVKDFAGNIATAQRTVCVEDKIAPSIENVNDTLIQIGSVWINQVSANDAYDNDPILNRTWFPEIVNTTVKGNYIATYVARDSSGNISAPKVVTYRVDDYIAPVIDLNSAELVYHDVATTYVPVKVTVSDNYYGPGNVSVTKISSNVNQNILGTYTEVYKAVDGSNNIAFKTRTVVVVDRQAPTLWGGTIYGCVGENIWPYWDLTTTDNYYGPDQLQSEIEIVSQNVNPNDEGIYYITYKVTDPSGNVSQPLTRQVIYTYWPRCINSTVSVNNVNTNDGFNVFPNPSKGNFKIDFLGKQIADAEVSVIDAQGKEVYKTVFNNVGSCDIILSDVAAGIYNVRINSQGTVVTRRIVIQ